MRILMIVRKFYPLLGGTESQAQKLAAKLIEMGVDVTIVTGWWVWGTSRQEVIEGVPVFRNFTSWSLFGIKGLRKFGGYIYIFSLFWYLWKNRNAYDLIHIHMLSYPAFPGVLAGRWLGKKNIIKIANSDTGSDIRRMRENDLIPGQKQMLPTALGADQMVAVSKRIVEELTEAGVPLERIELIPNGVEVENINHKCTYDIHENITLVFVGRLAHQKGLDVLLPAFKELVHCRPDIRWNLWVLGDGELRAELENVVRELGVTQEVKFWGKVDDVPNYLNQSDIFVLPSRSEGMSNALLEAMAHGLPCVATRINGNTDLIEDGKNGLLVSPECETELVKAVINLVDDKMLRQQVGKLARHTVKAHYGVDIIAERYLNLYNKLLQSPDVYNY